MTIKYTGNWFDANTIFLVDNNLDVFGPKMKETALTSDRTPKSRESDFSVTDAKAIRRKFEKSNWLHRNNKRVINSIEKSKNVLL